LPAFRADHAELSAEYDNMLACIRCGLCLTSCPTYVLSMQEAESPRGPHYAAGPVGVPYR